ncbi:MAG: pilus assembly protein PilM, partial [Microbacterium sp.]|nr:pilus assembly protein PilM [Microbacterium sp.]
MAKTVVGLEITEESVRAVEVTAGRAPALLAFGEVSLPPGAAKDSEILDASAVALAIRQLWT